MPRHAPVLECSPEDKASLLALSKCRNEEARAEGKEMQQVARELRVSIPTVRK